MHRSQLADCVTPVTMSWSVGFVFTFFICASHLSAFRGSHAFLHYKGARRWPRCQLSLRSIHLLSAPGTSAQQRQSLTSRLKESCLPSKCIQTENLNFQKTSPPLAFSRCQPPRSRLDSTGLATAGPFTFARYRLMHFRSDAGRLECRENEKL